MSMVPDVFDGLLNLLMALSDRVLPMVLPAVAGVVLLFGGAWLAHWVRFGVEEMMNALTVDRLCEKAGFHLFVQRLGMGRSPTRVGGFLAHWGVMTLFMVAAADVMGFPVVREYLVDFMVFLPGLVSAVLAMGAGLLLARFLGGLVQGAALANHVAESDFMGRACYWAVAVFSGVVALRQVGMDVSVVMDSPYFMPLLAAAFAAAVLLHVLEGRRSGEVLRGGRVPRALAK